MIQQRTGSLGENEALPEGDETLFLDRRLLVSILEACSSLSSLEVLHDQIAILKHDLDDPESRIRSADRGLEQCVEFQRGYLAGELEQIVSARTLARACYYVNRLIKAVSEIRTGPLNDINLNRWKEVADIHTDSLWIIERRDSSGAHTAGYWGNFVPQIPHQMMRRFTKKGEWVLDTFAGSGTTLIEGQRLGRNTLGLEIQSRMVEQARRLIAAEPNPHGVTIEVVEADSVTADYAALLARYGQQSVQLAILHPPYFDIIRFCDDPRDLGNAASVDDFLARFGQVVEATARVLDRGRYLVVVIGDKYAKGAWIPLGFLTMNEVTQRGFTLKSIVVKNFEGTLGKRNQKELWRYRALAGGFYVFKHEYILVFRKN